jgi:hypothetical protein
VSGRPVTRKTDRTFKKAKQTADIPEIVPVQAQVVSNPEPPQVASPAAVPLPPTPPPPPPPSLDGLLAAYSAGTVSLTTTLRQLGFCKDLLAVEIASVDADEVGNPLGIVK